MVNLTTLMVACTAMILGVTALDKATASQIRDELIKAKIIPEAIDDFEPISSLRVRYDENFDIYNGQHLKPEQTLVVPSVWFDAPSEDSEFTLAMVNLDTNGPLVRHWVATNVKGNDTAGVAFLSQAPVHEYTSYRGPTPPFGSTPHRIAFVLFEQQGKNHTFAPRIEGTALQNRDFFDLKQFAKDNHLKPISGAYFYSEYQEGFSQNYPPVSDQELKSSGQIKEDGSLADLINNVVDDLDQILDDVGINIGHDADPNATTPSDHEPKPTHGLLHDIVSMVDAVLADVGLGNDRDDTDRKGLTLTERIQEEGLLGLVGGLVDGLGQVLDSIDLNFHNKAENISLEATSTPQKSDANSTSSAVEPKPRHGLIQGVVNLLDDVLGSLLMGKSHHEKSQVHGSIMREGLIDLIDGLIGGLDEILGGLEGHGSDEVSSTKPKPTTTPQKSDEELASSTLEAKPTQGLLHRIADVVDDILDDTGLGKDDQNGNGTLLDFISNRFGYQFAAGEHEAVPSKDESGYQDTKDTLIQILNSVKNESSALVNPTMVSYISQFKDSLLIMRHSIVDDIKDNLNDTAVIAIDHDIEGDDNVIHKIPRRRHYESNEIREHGFPHKLSRR